MTRKDFSALGYNLGKGEVESSILSRSTKKPRIKSKPYLLPSERAQAEIAQEYAERCTQVWHDSDTPLPGASIDFLADERADSPTCLYRYYTADFRLLYVGVTCAPCSRNLQHWPSAWHFKSRLAMLEWFPNRKIAECAEDHAICNERPEHNSAHRGFTAVGRVCAPWYFDATQGVLIGCRQSFADPQCRGFSGVPMPDGFASPPPAKPDLTEAWWAT